MPHRSLAWIFSIVLLGADASILMAQNYPSRPIRIVTTEAGSGNDLVARLTAPELTVNLGQPVIVDNRGGASGIIAAQIVAKASPDGYTVLFYGSPLWLLPFMQTVPYDPVQAFSPVTLAASAPNILVVHPSLQVNSVKELISLAKGRSGELNYGSSSTGSSNHLASELFNAMAGVRIIRVPYKGTALALNDVIGGQVHMMFPVAPAGMPHVRAGRLKGLAVTSAAPSALVPGLPTVAESGLPGYESGSPFGVLAPAATPKALVNRIHREILRILERTDVRQRLFSAGVEVVGSSPAEFAATIKSEMTRFGKVIKDIGMKAN